MARGLGAIRATAPVVALTGCTGVLDPAGPVGAAQKLILLNSLGIMLAIIIPVIVATGAFAWWFRAGNKRAVYRPDWAYSGRIEAVVWAIPTMIILFLGGIAYIGSHQLDPYRPLVSSVRPIEVQVVSLDWKWLFIYPEQGVASVNRLVIPAGTPVRFRLTSATVWNTFFVPRLGSMIYTMNGMATTVHLQADRPGTFNGMSAHYSGDGFSDMDFQVEAVTPQAFAGWAAGTKGTGPVLDANGYRQLLRQTADVAPYTYRAVQPGLFDAVVVQKLPPGEGPQEGRGGPAVSSRSGA